MLEGREKGVRKELMTVGLVLKINRNLPDGEPRSVYHAERLACTDTVFSIFREWQVI